MCLWASRKVGRPVKWTGDRSEAFLADAHRAEESDLVFLSMRLATTPCGPLFQRHISPDRELAALVAGLPADRTTRPAMHRRPEVS